jgi:cytochrome b561
MSQYSKQTVKNNLEARYDNRVIIIHWISFLLIAALVPTGKILRDTDVSALKLALYNFHIIVGFLVFIMTIYRVVLFFTKPRPPKLNTGWVIHNKIIVWVQRLFYLALLTLGVSGLAVLLTTSLGDAFLKQSFLTLPPQIDSEIFEVHEFMANLLIVLFCAHMGGVVLHYYRHKENLLYRIFFKKISD